MIAFDKVGMASVLLRRAAFPILAIMLLLVAFPASAARVDDLFRQWLADDRWPAASARGVSRATFDAAFDGVKPNLDLPDLVMPGETAKTPKKQHQAEFGSPGA